jgi:hypothetical protein
MKKHIDGVARCELPLDSSCLYPATKQVVYIDIHEPVYGNLKERRGKSWIPVLYHFSEALVKPKYIFFIVAYIDDCAPYREILLEAFNQFKKVAAKNDCEMVFTKSTNEYRFLQSRIRFIEARQFVPRYKELLCGRKATIICDHEVLLPPTVIEYSNAHHS